jgi:energy-coupling factor transport system permease protein
VTLVLSAFLALMVLDGLFPAMLILAASVYLLARARCIRDWFFLAKIMAALSLFVFAANFLLARLGGEVYWEYGPVPIVGMLDLTSVEVMVSLTAAVKLVAVVSVFLLLTLTIHPDGLFSLFSRRLPRSTGLFLSLTAVLYPAMARDASAVADAHRSRGLEMDSGGIIRRARARFPIVRPMFANAMERSLDLGEAMAARGWGNDGTGGDGPRPRSSVSPFAAGRNRYPLQGRAGSALHLAGAFLIFVSVAEVMFLLGDAGGSALGAGPQAFAEALTEPSAGMLSSPLALLSGLLPYVFILSMMLVFISPSLVGGGDAHLPVRSHGTSGTHAGTTGGGEMP